MKIALFIFGLAFLGAFTAIEARANLEVGTSVQIRATTEFYTPLATCGTWVEVGSYGRCWRPVGVVVGWRPYCDGYWVWTDCGWYWASDEPWAWACYHYGWWFYDDTYGWVWVPDIEWAPCWVCWCYGGGYIGWAPLPPHGFFARRPADRAFVFVANENFSSRIRPSVVVADNAEIFKQAKYVSNIRQVRRDVDGNGARKVMINEGPGLAAIQKATGKQFKALAITKAVRSTPTPALPGPPNKPDQPPNKTAPGNAVKPDGQKPPQPPNPQTPPAGGIPPEPGQKESPPPSMGHPPGPDVIPPGTPPDNPGRGQENGRRHGRGLGGD